GEGRETERAFSPLFGLGGFGRAPAAQWDRGPDAQMPLPVRAATMSARDAGEPAVLSSAASGPQTTVRFLQRPGPLRRRLPVPAGPAVVSGSRAPRNVGERRAEGPGKAQERLAARRTRVAT